MLSPEKKEIKLGRSSYYLIFFPLVSLWSYIGPLLLTFFLMLFLESFVPYLNKAYQRYSLRLPPLLQLKKLVHKERDELLYQIINDVALIMLESLKANHF